MSRTFMLNNLTFKFEDADVDTGHGTIVFKIESKEILIKSIISTAQADAIGNVFKAVARVRGFEG